MGSSCPGPPEASAGALARVAITTVHGSSPASPGHSALRCEHSSWFEYERALPHSPPSPRLTAAARHRPDTSPIAANIPSWFEYKRALPHSPHSPRLTAAVRPRLDTPPVAANIPSWFEYKRALPHSPPSPRLTAAARHRPTISCSLEHPMPFEHERALPHSPPSPRLTAAARPRLDTPPIAANIPSGFEHERALPHSPLTYFCRGEPPHRVICDLVRLRKPAPRRRTRDSRPFP